VPVNDPAVMATALQPQFVMPRPAREEWERLPWLFDEPKRMARSPSGWILAWLIILATADGIAAYAAGQLSVRREWATPVASAARLQSPSAEDSRLVAEQIVAAGRVGWQRRRPNAAN
jgi:hypothetical protein